MPAVVPCRRALPLTPSTIDPPPPQQEKKCEQPALRRGSRSTIQIGVRIPDGLLKKSRSSKPTVLVDVDFDDTLEDLKQKLVQLHGLPHIQAPLRVRGNPVDDQYKISDLGLESGDLISYPSAGGNLATLSDRQDMVE